MKEFIINCEEKEDLILEVNNIIYDIIENSGAFFVTQKCYNGEIESIYLHHFPHSDDIVIELNGVLTTLDKNIVGDILVQWCWARS